MKVLIGNAKGPKGDTGSKGDKGDKGNTGQRGSRWTSGTGITGTSTIGTKFPDSGITDAQLFDYYINTDTGNLYECTVPGTADIAEWVYMSNFKGPKGDTGPTGSISDINDQKPTYLEASKLENIESGETVQKSFGKLKKAVSVLISHYMQKATQNILGHVKLSNSAAITTAGEYALDAIEKNASIEGTLANMISQANSNLGEYIKRDGSTYAVGNVPDLNNFFTGIALVESGTKNIPSSAWWLILAAGAATISTQIAFSHGLGKIWWRTGGKDGWSEWSEIR